MITLDNTKLMITLRNSPTKVKSNIPDAMFEITLHMKQINYRHLHYFYTVATEGGVHKAANKLNVTPQTVSGQISSMESYLGFSLFTRVDKRMVLSEMGNIAYTYADDIFRLGAELSDVLTRQVVRGEVNYVVGVIDSVPKIFAYDLLRESFKVEKQLKLNVREGDFESLLSEFALNKLDLIISDRPIPPRFGVKGYSHIIAESGFTFFSSTDLPLPDVNNFPACLNNYPVLMPGDKSLQKSLLLSWLDSESVYPTIVAEFDDTALMKLFGQEGHGGFFSPTMIEPFILSQYQPLRIIGRTVAVKDQFYAITPQRRVANPATQFVIQEARKLTMRAVNDHLED